MAARAPAAGSDSYRSHVDTPPSAPARSPVQPRLGPIEFDVRAWVYGTITLMSVLVVYDGWADLKRDLGVVLVLVGPTIALAAAHVFADVLDHQVDYGRPLTGREWRQVLGHGVDFLLVGVPPLAVFAVARVLGQDVTTGLQWTVFLGAASLGFWGYVAGVRVGYRGWRLLASTLTGLLLGLLIVGLQIALKPH